MLSIVILGTGNVAHHLFQFCFSSSEARVIQVFGRNTSAIKKFEARVATTVFPEEIMDADLYLIAVSDAAIAEVSALLKTKKGLVAHTSGSLSLDLLQSNRKSVFYPLQTFTENKSLNFTSLPICLEAENERDYELLGRLASSLSNNVYRITTPQRRSLHLAAVFANNFTNHLYQIAEEICNSEGVTFEMLHPLIAETADKIRFLPPKNAQTGPARRKDLITLQRHLDMLQDPEHRKIYQAMSNSIQKMYEEKL